MIFFWNNFSFIQRGIAFLKDLYSKFSYTRKFLNKNNKPDTEKLTLGTAGVLKAVTNNYAYNTAPEVERAFANQALQDSKQELFVPKDIDTDKLQKFVQERSNDVGIVGDLIVKLQNVNKELINTTLNPKGEDFSSKIDRIMAHCV